VLVVVAPGVVADKQSQGVSGAYTPSAALERLLAGTGLKPERTQNGGFTLAAAGSDRADAAARDLGNGASAAVSTVKEVIVTANKRAESMSKVGEGISAVTSAQLDSLQANSMADYLQLLPGVGMQSFGAPGYGTIEIRGISPQSVGATIATYIDDIPFGGSSAVGEGGEFTPDLDPADIERVEVLKGPQGTLYGASSLGGVIKYVTKQPSLTRTEGSLSEEVEDVDAGGWGGKIRGSYSTPLADNVAVRVSGYYRWIPGYIDDIGYAGKDANNGTDYGVRATVLWKPTSNLSVNLNAMTQATRQNGYNTVDMQAGATAPIFKPLYGDLQELRYVQEYFQYRTDLVSAEINYQTPYGTLLSATSYSKIKPIAQLDSTLDFAAFGLTTTSNPIASLSHHIDEQETEELRFTSNRLGNLEFIAGLFYQHEDLNDGANFPTFNAGGHTVDTTAPLLGYYNRTGMLEEVAGFVNATYYILPNLDVTVGYRYSDIWQHRDSEIAGTLYEGCPTCTETDSLSVHNSPSTYLAGLRWRATDDVMFYLRAASGYRPGGVRSPLPGGPANFGLTYTSDSIWSYEAGMKVKALNGRLTFDVDGYQIDWTNIQALVYVGPFNTDGNGGSAVSRGVELQSAFVPITGLRLTVNGAWTDAYFRTTDPSVMVTAGQQLYYVPHLTGSVGAEYAWPIRRFQANVGGDLSYEGSQYDSTNYLLPGYALLNLRAGLKWDRYTLNLFVKNALNKRAIIGDDAFVPGFPYDITINQPMTVGVSFSQRF
jgi:iron complex outermembrane receptor protein